MWWAWHESVFAIGLTLSDHRQPGSKVYRPMVVSPIFTTWTCPRSKVLVSSGLSKPLFVTPISTPSFRVHDPSSDPARRTVGGDPGMRSANRSSSFRGIDEEGT